MAYPTKKQKKAAQASKRKQQTDKFGDRELPKKVIKEIAKADSFTVKDRSENASQNGETIQSVASITNQTAPQPTYPANAIPSSMSIVPLVQYSSLQGEIGQATTGAARGNWMVDGVVSGLGQSSLEAGRDEMIEELAKRVETLEITLKVKDKELEETKTKCEELKCGNDLFQQENMRLNCELVELRQRIPITVKSSDDDTDRFSDFCNAGL